jgi:hypothetical protein
LIGKGERTTRTRGDHKAEARGDRTTRTRAYADLGLDRVILQGFQAVSDPGHLPALAEDGAAARFMERAAA